MYYYIQNKNTNTSLWLDYSTPNIGGVSVKGSPSHIPPLNFAQDDDTIKNVIGNKRNNK